MTTLIASFILATTATQETCECKPMPNFSLKASDGNTYSQASLVKKDTVVVFFSNGCPHNPKAAPDMNKLKAIFGSKVSIVGMSNLNATEAKAYANELNLKFPLLADPDGKIIEKFGATHSLDFALVCSKDKKIGKLWNGYSRTIIGELFAEIKHHGGPAIKADLSSFPTGRQSGCGF